MIGRPVTGAADEIVVFPAVAESQSFFSLLCLMFAEQLHEFFRYDQRPLACFCFWIADTFFTVHTKQVVPDFDRVLTEVDVALHEAENLSTAKAKPYCKFYRDLMHSTLYGRQKPLDLFVGVDVRLILFLLRRARQFSYVMI